MKLTKEKLNELLFYIENDDFEKALIFKLCYIYGRNAREVLELTVDAINLTDETITFTTQTTPVTYPLNSAISEDLISIIYNDGLRSDDYIFRIDTTLIIAVKSLNVYLADTIKSLNRSLDLEIPNLTTKDFKNLRGQHLFLDGVSIQTIHEFYHHSNMKSTKKNINYFELKKLKYEANTINEIFDDLTDIHIYYEDHYDDTDVIVVSDENGNSIVIEIDYPEHTINIDSSEDNPLISKISSIDSDKLFDELRKLKKPGQYKIIDGMRFLKN